MFGERVCILYTDIDSFFLQFSIQDLALELNRDQSMRDWFDLTEIPAVHISEFGAPNDPHGGLVGYFKD